MKDEDCKKIPKMKLSDLENILNKELKNRKACDIYKLTAEHLKYCGNEAKVVLLNLLNDIIENMYYLECPQVKAGLGSAAYKGRKKPRSLASSYRRITVTPQIGSLLDRYIDPIAEAIFRPTQTVTNMVSLETYPTSCLLFCAENARDGPWTSRRPASV